MRRMSYCMVAAAAYSRSGNNSAHTR
jgi:hypothetical protein